MKYIVMCALLILTACGFTPVYGTKSTAAGKLDTIQIDVIPNREGQIVRNYLIDRFYRDGYPTNPQYQLSVSGVTEDVIEIAIDKDDEASRAQLRQRATFTLKDLDNNQVVLTRTVRATSGYNILAGQFTTYVTEEDARQQALRAIADNITTQLEIYFNR